MRDNFVKVRLSSEEREELDDLKSIYKVDGDSEMVRLALRYIARKRPILVETLRPVGKAFATTPGMA